MHARELAELAALVSAHGPVFIRSGLPIPERNIEAYWVASKSRLDRWGRTLKQISARAAEQGRLSTAAQETLVRGVVEEIFTGEILTRVWAAVACAHDRRLSADLAEPIARGVLIAHLEARHRVLTLLLQGSAVSPDLGVKLNRLRRHTERWTDMFVGYLTGLEDVAEFAVNPERARDFAEDLRFQAKMPGGRHAWPLIQASLRSALDKGLTTASPNGDLNARIAQSILSCFQPELFDGTGQFRTLWLDRLTNTADDAQGMLEELTADYEPSHPHSGQVSGARFRRFGG
ncbi:MAG: hypothetical protein GXX96_19920 [Planctomycetaceae bacterium]|nr:hypothetical protein [Planctomycetaceae bacterium]